MNSPAALDVAAPLVSVLMTAYNREKYIGDAISSVLASSFKDFELIIVDDCSTDATVEIAQEYANQDSRIQIFRNERNLGDYPNRNQAAAYARGKYLKYLDSDDMIYSHGLAVMIDMMKRHPLAGFGLSAIAEASRPHPVIMTPEESYRRNFFCGDLFGRAPGSSIIRKDAFVSVGGFSNRSYVSDHDLWLKLARQYCLITFPRDLIWDRVHDEQERNYDLANVGEIQSKHYLIDVDALKHTECPLSGCDAKRAIRELKLRHYGAIMRLAIRHRNFKEALNYLMHITGALLPSRSD